MQGTRQIAKGVESQVVNWNVLTEISSEIGTEKRNSNTPIAKNRHQSNRFILRRQIFHLQIDRAVRKSWEK